MSMQFVFNGSKMVYRKVTPTPVKKTDGVKAEAVPNKRIDNIGAGLSTPEVKMPPKETEASKKQLRQKIFADLAKIL